MTQVINKLTVRSIIQAGDAIETLVKADQANKYVLSSATRIKLAGNLRKTRPVRDDYIEQRNALVVKFGEKVIKDGKETDQIEIQPDSKNKPEFNKEHDGMLNSETDVALSKVSQVDLFGFTDEQVAANPALKQNQIDINLLLALQGAGVIE